MRDWDIHECETKAAAVEHVFATHPSFLELARKLVRVLAPSDDRDTAIFHLVEAMRHVDQAPRQH